MFATISSTTKILRDNLLLPTSRDFSCKARTKTVKCTLTKSASVSGNFRSSSLRKESRKFQRLHRIESGRNPDWYDSSVEELDPELELWRGVNCFNNGEFYAAHDIFEEMWHNAQEPQRGCLHGVLQCAVGLHHLMNSNHRGCMLELGEGLRKLNRIHTSENLTSFHDQMDDILEFVYSTQMEHAACHEEECVALLGDEESYNLLGNFARGEDLYIIEEMDGVQKLIFHPSKLKAAAKEVEDPGNSYSYLIQTVNCPVLRLAFEDFEDL